MEIQIEKRIQTETKSFDSRIKPSFTWLAKVKSFLFAKEKDPSLRQNPLDFIEYLQIGVPGEDENKK